jgi:hypothetical protein
MSKFWVYENWTTQRALLHRGACGACGACKHGHGIWGGGTRPSSKWHGPYDTVELAESAPLWPRLKIRACGLCMK